MPVSIKPDKSLPTPLIHQRVAETADAAKLVDVHYASAYGITARYYTDEILQACSPVPDEKRRNWLARLITANSTLCTIALSEQKNVFLYRAA